MCVRAFFPLVALACFSSIPLWLILPVPTAHTLIQFTVSHSNRFLFWAHSVGPLSVYFHRSLSLLIFSLLSQHFKIHEHRTFPQLVLLYTLTFFFRGLSFFSSSFNIFNEHPLSIKTYFLPSP